MKHSKRGTKFDNTAMPASKNPYVAQSGPDRVTAFKDAVGLAAIDAAHLLGASLSVFYKWQAGHAPLPLDVRYHMQALETLPKTRLDVLIAERTGG